MEKGTFYNVIVCANIQIKNALNGLYSGSFKALNVIE